MANQSLFWLTKRNSFARSVVQRYASRQGLAEGALGVVGLVVPSGGALSMASSLAMQAPTVYQPMVRELVHVYAAPSTAIAALSEPTAHGVASLRNSSSDAFGAYLSSEFGQDFLLSLLTDMLPELGVGAAMNFLPGVVRAVMGTGLNSTLSVTLTWRVGAMAVLFFLNDWEWVGNKAKTSALARRIIGKPIADANERDPFQDLLQRLPHLHARAAADLGRDVATWRRDDPAAGDAAIREHLEQKGIPTDLIEAALNVR